MAEQVTHAEAIVSPEDITVTETAAELADESELDEETAEKVFYLVETRAENRDEDRTDLIIVLEEWAYEDWSDYDVRDEPVLLVGRVEDHSEKAFYLQGAFEVRMDTIDGKSLDEVKDMYVTSILRWVDETDTDFVSAEGETYLPKSAVSGIYSLE